MNVGWVWGPKNLYDHSYVVFSPLPKVHRRSRFFSSCTATQLCVLSESASNKGLQSDKEP